MSDSSKREREIFGEAMELPSLEAQRAFVRGACGGDESLLHAVEGLLEAYSQAGGFIPPRHTGSMEQPEVAIPGAEVGSVIGRYKLLEKIGEGGCGIVYVAGQEEGVRRRVALKIIKLGMDTKQVIARFDAERQALALMDHPNIAKIFDAGATETGRPFFVMELVRGIKITDYCDQQNLAPRERLDLFMQVCRAIQHAHQKGIIHRDIKPSNVLVASDDGAPVPKVIDFGIAKATQGRLTDHTVYTAFEQFMGTPAYMSPEQASLNLQDIDTRTDIYSLGVLLYELLTGATPFNAKDLLSRGLDEMRRTIREVEPVKPSTRLTQEFAGAAVTELNSGPEVRESKSEEKIRGRSRRLLQEVRGDLDWIVMKCLEKDRSRRYETANGLANDINRHLSNEPIVARPPSKLYRLQKAVQRNKLAFGATGAVVVSLMVGLSIATWALVRERTARHEAEASANRALAEASRNEAVNKFFANSPNLGLRGRDTTVAIVMLDELSSRADRELSKQPVVQGDIFVFIASRVAGLDDYARAITNMSKGVEAYRRAYTNPEPRLARALGMLGTLQSLNKQSFLGKANALLGVAVARQCRDPETLAACLIDAAKSFKDSAEPDPEAIPLLREACLLSKKLPPGNLWQIESLRLLAEALASDGKRDEARTIGGEALRLAPLDEDLKKFLTTLGGEQPSTQGQPNRP